MLIVNTIVFKHNRSQKMNKNEEFVAINGLQSLFYIFEYVKKN
jgi:hypothetical protein